MQRRLTCSAIKLSLTPVVPGYWSDALSRNGVERETGAGPDNAASQICFLDQLANGKIAATFENGQEAGITSILEAMDCDVALLDYDLDSRDDLCLAGGGSLPVAKTISGHPPCLFRNLGDWTFEAVSRSANLQVKGHYTHGAVAAEAADQRIRVIETSDPIAN